MTYTIYHANGLAVSVPDNAIDVQFYDSASKIGTQLVGQNAIGYGSPIAQNFLQMTENFYGPTAPSNAKALRGQLWFDSASSVLKVNVSSTVGTPNWAGIGTIADPSAVTGTDGQVKVNGSVVSIWANGAWRQIFPAVYS
jgi:hypothetical protein